MSEGRISFGQLLRTTLSDCAANHGPDDSPPVGAMAAPVQLAASTEPSVRRARRRWAERIVAVSVWMYLVVLLGSWLLIRFAGDRWWFATLMLFGPRWLAVTPILVLAPAAALTRRRLLWVLALACLVAVGPIMGLCLPWGRLAASGGASIRVLTCNVKGHCRDNRELNTLLHEESPDVVALEGCWRKARVEWPADWQVYQEGEIVIASRYRLRDPQSVLGDPPAAGWPRPHLLRCVVESPCGAFSLVAVHLPSPHQGISDVLDRSTMIQPSRRATVLREIAIRQQASQSVYRGVGALSEPLVLVGDFNMPTESAIYRQYWSGFSNAFTRCGFGFGYTEWPTRRSLFGIRIDHVLTGPQWRPQRCWVGRDVGSDHLPVIADIGWRDPS